MLPKPRAGGYYDITGQVISWNENTKETRMYIEKKATTMKLLKDVLTRAGATQIQVSPFEHNDYKMPVCALRSVREHSARDGSRVKEFGEIKIKLKPSSTTKESASPQKRSKSGQEGGVETGGADKTLVETNATLAQTAATLSETNASTIEREAAVAAENERLRALTFQMRGHMGAARRQENVPVHAALDFANEKVEFEREKAQMERERREDWQAVAERYQKEADETKSRLVHTQDLLIQQLMGRSV